MRRLVRVKAAMGVGTVVALVGMAHPRVGSRGAGGRPRFGRRQRGSGAGDSYPQRALGQPSYRDRAERWLLRERKHQRGQASRRAGSRGPVRLPSATSACSGLLGLGDAVQGPIDPQTGQFSFVDNVLGGVIVTTANGNFDQGNPYYAATVDATVDIPGACKYTVPGGFTFCPPAWQACAFPAARVVGYRAR